MPNRNPATPFKAATKAADNSHHSLTEVLDAWDAMLAAKHWPGRYNVPFVSAMNISSNHVGVIHSNFSRTQCVDETNTSLPMGTKDYTIIMYCPSMSVLYGPGGAGNIPATSKLGGLVIRQVTSPSLDLVRYNQFY